MADYHGIRVTRGEGGIRPFTTPSQSTLGVVVPGTPKAGDNSDFTDDAGNVEYNKPHYITEVPSTESFDPSDTGNAFGGQVFDQIFRHGRIPTQVVFVPPGTSQSARAAITTLTERERAADAIDTKGKLDALAGASFAILSVGAYKYLAFGGGGAVSTADVALLQQLQPGDKIEIKATGGTGVALASYVVERVYSANNAWIRINDAADYGTLAAATDYDIQFPQRDARTAAQNEYDNLLGRQHAQTGIYALRAASPKPKILCLGHIGAASVIGGAANGLATSLADLARELGSIGVLDGPGTDLDDALIAATLYSGPHIYFVDPWIRQAYNNAAFVPSSPTVAASIALNDYERGYWSSPSNRNLAGVLGTNRDISNGFVGSEADVLNSSQIATIIKDGGFRLWGNEGLDMTDPTYRFLQIYRTEQAIRESLQISLKWAIAQNITVRFFENVALSTQGFLNKLQSQGAITGGECYPNRDANTPANIKAGIASFIVNWSGVYPAQTIDVKLDLVDKFLISNLLDLI